MATDARRESVIFWPARTALLREPLTGAQREHELKPNNPLPLAMNSISARVSILGFSRRE